MAPVKKAFQPFSLAATQALAGPRELGNYNYWFKFFAEDLMAAYWPEGR
jgi:hypothetical protein